MFTCQYPFLGDVQAYRLAAQRRYVIGCTSALAHCRTIGTGGKCLTRSSQGRYFTGLPIWRLYWKVISKHKTKLA